MDFPAAGAVGDIERKMKMKKLMILLAVVCSVSMAKAAFVNWKFGKDTSMNGYTVYAFDSANQSTVLAALAAYDADAQTTINGLVLSSETVKKGNASGDGVDVGSATALMLLAVNGAFDDGVTFTYDTLDISGYTYTPPDLAPATTPTLSALTHSGPVVAVGTPEPTSGLLMLVGLGALALRRRKA